MKKVILKSIACLMAVAAFAAIQGCSEKEQKPQQEPEIPEGYVDLNLPSGTLWKAENEVNDADDTTDFFSYDDAVAIFGDKLPTKVQFEELITECQWRKRGDYYSVIGPNGDSIFIQLVGYRGCDGTIGIVGEGASYWTSDVYNTEKAYGFYLYANYPGVYEGPRCAGRYVRLVVD